MKKLLAPLLLLGALLLSPAAAFAAADCDSVVTDDANIFGSGASQVQSAANELTKLGVTVRIRTVPDFGSAGSLDNYEAGLEKTCKSWQDASGNPRNNLVAIMVSMAPKHEVSVNFGDQWKPALGGNYTNIQTSMTPYLRDGNFAGAFTYGINAAAGFINAQLNPPKTNTTGPTTIINQAPSDNSGFVSLLFWALGIAAAALIALFGFRAFMGAARTRETARTAQLKAKSAQTSCANLINGFDGTVLAARVNQVALTVSDQDAAAFKSQLVSIVTDQKSAAADMANYSQNAGMNPEQTGLSADQYDVIAGSYSAVLKKLNAVSDSKSKFEAALAEAEQSAKQAPQTIASSTAKIDAAKKGVAAQGKAGFQTAVPDAKLLEADTLLAQAADFLKSNRAGAAGSSATLAAKKADEAVSIAESLSKRRDASVAAIAALSSRIEDAKKIASDAKPVFEQVEADYVADSWKNIAGNGTEGQKRILSAEQALKDATDAAGMNTQNWDGADTLVVQANAKLDEALKLFAAIVALSASLADAKKKAQPEIDAAKADIDKASAYLTQWGKDVKDSLDDDLAKAKKLLKGAGDELAKKQPDYLLVVKTALAANHAADDILAEAQNEHESMERKRRLDVSLMQEASRSIDAATSYISNHKSDVGSKARGRLVDAKAFFAQAQSERSLDKRIDLAKLADQSADSALAKAQSDFGDAESERRRARERDSDSFNTGIVLGSLASSSSSHRTSESWGSQRPSTDFGHHNGGSIDFGSSSSSGSSIDFGSSGHNGGSSSW